MLQAKDKLDATMECPACGGGANMSVTKNMTVFAYCKEIVDKEANEKCGYRAFLGRTKSKDIIREYNEKMKEFKNVELQQETQANIEHNQRAEGSTAGSGAGDGGDVGESSIPAPAARGLGAKLGGIFAGSTAFD